MKVYTKTGDTGTTSLFNGARVPKHNARVEAYGTVDECNAAIGMALSHLPCDSAVDDASLTSLQERLTALQSRLFDLGAHLATPRDASSRVALAKTAFPPAAEEEVEGWIDEMEEGLAPLTGFILPAGSPAAAALHVARTVARRAERAVTVLLDEGESEDTIDPAAYRFINRLSDFLFVASRVANKAVGIEDVLWVKAR